jgi:uncharacterized protein YqhQ
MLSILISHHFCYPLISKNLKPKFDFAVGGQALIEGVMMRSPNFVVVAVRKPNGDLKLHDWRYVSLTKRYRILGLPIIRGAVNMVETMIIGMRAMNISADESIVDETETVTSKNDQETIIEDHNKSYFTELKEGGILLLNFVIALGFAIALFKFVPLYITEFIRDYSSFVQHSTLAYNIIDGVIKLLVFVLYIAGISLIPSIGRVFEYHGAEHKAIWAYERGESLDKVEPALGMTRFHPRCGTSFIFIVIIISIVIYSFLPRDPELWSQLVRRVLVLPFIAGVAYEALKLSAKYQNHPLVKLLVKPGLWFQKLTTREPDALEQEVALVSLKHALELEATVTKPTAS